MRATGSRRSRGALFALAIAMLMPSAAQAQERLAPELDRNAGQTFVAASPGLEGILSGGAPVSLKQLSAMERQQREVVRRAAECTVSVQIGISQGCGVIVSGDGYVLTAAHVAMRANRDVSLTLSDGRKIAGRTLGLNREVDAGLIKIVDDTNNGKPWPHATLGRSNHLEPGMWCIAMGHPGGYALDRGAVARVGRILAVRRGAIVTDCALIGGDSGGPLFDLQGELIGIHSRIGNDITDNLHVPVDHYDRTWDRLAAAEVWGYLPGFRPVIGVRGTSNSDVAEIREIIPGSPAANAGLLPGDIIQQFGDVNISDFPSLKSAVDNTMPGEQIRLRIRRDDSTMRVVLEIGRDPNS